VQKSGEVGFGDRHCVPPGGTAVTLILYKLPDLSKCPMTDIPQGVTIVAEALDCSARLH
jgi:hypothetical protein